MQRTELLREVQKLSAVKAKPIALPPPCPTAVLVPQSSSLLSLLNKIFQALVSGKPKLSMCTRVCWQLSNSAKETQFQVLSNCVTMSYLETKFPHL